MADLQAKNILITGASSGIGRTCAILASKHGATVNLIGRNKDRLLDTFQQLDKGNHQFYIFDVTNFNDIENLVDGIVSKTGKINGFIHSAGVEATIPIQAMNIEKYQNIYSVNVIAAFEIARILSKKKYANENGGSYVFISSVMGLVGQKGKVAYCSSKSALIGGSKALALELAIKKIRINCILPGLVKTEMTNAMLASLPENSVNEIIKKHPLGIGEPEDIANASLFLLSDGSKWITGTNLIIDGGYTAE